MFGGVCWLLCVADIRVVLFCRYRFVVCLFRCVWVCVLRVGVVRVCVLLCCCCVLCCVVQFSVCLLLWWLLVVAL